MIGLFHGAILRAGLAGVFLMLGTATLHAGFDGGLSHRDGRQAIGRLYEIDVAGGRPRSLAGGADGDRDGSRRASGAIGWALRHVQPIEWPQT